MGPLWDRCGCLTTTQKIMYSKTYLPLSFRRISASSNPRSPREVGMRKIYTCWKKLKLHLLFCGCNHWCKMQCNIITIGLFISILGQHQHKQLVSFLHSLPEKPNMNHQFPTLPMKSEYWETLPTHVFSVRERARYHQLRVKELTVSETLEKLW